MRVEKGDLFTCSECGKTDIIDSGHDEKVREEKEVFGFELIDEDRDIVCDDCYQSILKRNGIIYQCSID